MLMRQGFAAVTCGVLLLASCSEQNPNTPENASQDAIPTEETADRAALPEPARQHTGNERVTAQPAAIEPAGRIAVGDEAPGFELKDQNGRQHTLEDLLQEGTVALVFFRSADW